MVRRAIVAAVLALAPASTAFAPSAYAATETACSGKGGIVGATADQFGVWYHCGNGTDEYYPFL